MNTKTVKEKVIEIIESMYRTQAPYSEWAEEIDKLYREEMRDIFPTRDIIFRKIKTTKLKEMPKDYSSYTCCNIEVNEPAGTEVMCRSCSEWCSTK